MYVVQNEEALVSAGFSSRSNKNLFIPTPFT